MSKDWWLTYLRASWAWLRAACSGERLLRDMRSMLYRGQPVRWDPRSRRLYVTPRREWRQKGIRQMTRWLGLAVLLCVATPAGSATYRTYGQVTIDNTTGGVALTASIITPSGQPQMQHCMLRSETAEIRYRVDGGAPTTSVGTPLEPLEVLRLDSHVELDAFRAIRTGSTSATLNAVCWN